VKRLCVVPVVVFAALACAGSAQATGCKVTALEGFPAIGGLKASGTGCASANAVAAAIQDGWAKHNQFVTRVRTWEFPRDEAGRRLTWNCKYTAMPASNGPEGWLPPYYRARCTRLDAVVSIGSLHS
jgi:hypothetical protein